MFKLLVFAELPCKGFELDGRCFCVAPVEMRFLEPTDELPVNPVLRYYESTFCFRLAIPLVKECGMDCWTARTGP